MYTSLQTRMSLEQLVWISKVLTEQNILKQEDQLLLAQDHQVEEVRSQLLVNYKFLTQLNATDSRTREEQLPLTRQSPPEAGKGWPIANGYNIIGHDTKYVITTSR